MLMLILDTILDYMMDFVWFYGKAIGHIHSQQRNHEKALENFKKATRINQHDAEVS